MMRKRFNQSKPGAPIAKTLKLLVGTKTDDELVPLHVKDADILTVFGYLSQLYALYRKAEDLPTIVMKHQFYSVIGNRTNVDQTIASLQVSGKVRVFKTSLGTDQFCTMLTSDYVDYVRMISNLPTDTNSIESVDMNDKVRIKVLLKFLEEFIPNYSDIYVSLKVLNAKYKFVDSHITLLIKAGVLTSKDAGCWWLAIPNVGKFLKTLRKGRGHTLQTIKRSKYKELSVKNLLARKPPSSIKLGWHFHIHDLIGADIISSIKSTNGVILRVVTV